MNTMNVQLNDKLRTAKILAFKQLKAKGPRGVGRKMVNGKMVDMKQTGMLYFDENQDGIVEDASGEYIATLNPGQILKYDLEEGSTVVGLWINGGPYSKSSYFFVVNTYPPHGKDKRDKSRKRPAYMTRKVIAAQQRMLQQQQQQQAYGMQPAFYPQHMAPMQHQHYQQQQQQESTPFNPRQQQQQQQQHPQHIQTFQQYQQQLQQQQKQQQQQQTTHFPQQHYQPTMSSMASSSGTETGSPDPTTQQEQLSQLQGLHQQQLFMLQMYQQQQMALASQLVLKQQQQGMQGMPQQQNQQHQQQQAQLAKILAEQAKVAEVVAAQVAQSQAPYIGDAAHSLCKNGIATHFPIMSQPESEQTGGYPTQTQSNKNEERTALKARPVVGVGSVKNNQQNSPAKYTAHDLSSVSERSTVDGTSVHNLPRVNTTLSNQIQDHDESETISMFGLNGGVRQGSVTCPFNHTRGKPVMDWGVEDDIVQTTSYPGGNNNNMQQQDSYSVDLNKTEPPPYSEVSSALKFNALKIETTASSSSPTSKHAPVVETPILSRPPMNPNRRGSLKSVATANSVTSESINDISLVPAQMTQNRQQQQTPTTMFDMSHLDYELEISRQRMVGRSAVTPSAQMLRGVSRQNKDWSTDKWSSDLIGL